MLRRVPNLLNFHPCVTLSPILNNSPVLKVACQHRRNRPHSVSFKMWKLILLRRRNLAACALSASAVAAVDLVQWNKKDEDESLLNKDTKVAKGSHQQPAIQWNLGYPTIRQGPSSLIPSFMQVTQSQCEPIQPTITQQSRVAVAALNRRATIRLLKESSIPIQSMHSKYRTNWSNPIGEGAFGAVYKSTNRQTGDGVAMKKIPKKLTDNTSFQNEVNALVQVRNNGGHPHICSLKEIFEDGRYYYMVLDLVSGGEMFEHLITLGAYSEADASRLVKEVAAALCFLHGIGIVHGDLKPENLMLSTDRAEDSTIKIVDFGCAQISEDGSVTSKSSAGNTPAYCPPEVLENTTAPITPAMDVWGLGIILYIMLTGLHPFDLNGKLRI